MTKIKRLGRATLVIDLIFTVVGGILFLCALKAIKEMDWSGSPDMSEYGALSMLVLALVGAAMLVILAVPFVHMALGGISSVMMLFQTLTGKRGFSIVSLLIHLLLAIIDGALVLGSLSIVVESLIVLGDPLAVIESGGLLLLASCVPLAMAGVAFALNIKAAEAKREPAE